MTSPSSPLRRRTLVAAVAGLIAIVALGLAVRQWHDDDSATRDTASTATSGDATTTSTAAEPGQTYEVGRRELDLVDMSRPTDAWPEGNIAARPTRPLPTLVLYPTTDSGAADVPAAEGPFPLVVFSHGSGGNPLFYAPFLQPLVREGYVVALPRFPLTSEPGSPYDDARNQPADVSFVLDSVLALSDDASSWLGGRIAEDRIAAAGHSLGAVTTIGVTYDTCCRDPRIDAAVAVSGTAVASGDGTLDDPPPTPLLLVHGALDETVPVSGSDTFFDDTTGPTYYLRLDKADHTTFILTEAGDLTFDAVRAFLDAYLEDRPNEFATLPDTVTASGLGEWRTRNPPTTD